MFQTIETFNTEFSADSVEWCPAENFNDIFVCGTYQLAPDETEDRTNCSHGEKKKRIGRIYLFQVVKNEKVQLKLLQKLDTSAVLDMKWAHVKINNKVLLGVVNSEGFLHIYELKDNEQVNLKFLSEILVNDSIEKSVLALSLDWSTGKRDENESVNVRIAVSDSLGSISLFKLTANGNGIEKIQLWHAHDFEAWITAFDYWDTNVIYTGGDDSKFLKFDSRIEMKPIAINRSHNAGVTSLHSNWKKQYCLISGSYDENFRTWDTRNLCRPLSSLNLSGGIWRLKWDPYKAENVLAACMYNGFFIVNCENLEKPKLLSEYKEHESIAYGCDWLQKGNKKIVEGENVTLIGTCSFYDHILKISNVTIEKLNIV